MKKNIVILTIATLMNSSAYALQARNLSVSSFAGLPNNSGMKEIVDPCLRNLNGLITPSFPTNPTFTVPAINNGVSIFDFTVKNIEKEKNKVKIINYNKQRSKLVVQVMEHLANIIKLKFEITNSLLENREIYGKYISLKLLRKELDERIAVLEEKIENHDQELEEKISQAASLAHSENLVALIESIKEKESAEKQYYFESLTRLREKEMKVFDEYYIAFEKWAPFDALSGQFDQVESSLMRSLETLRKMDFQFSESLDVDTEVGLPANNERWFNGISSVTSALGMATLNEESGTVENKWVNVLKDECSNF